MTTKDSMIAKLGGEEAYREHMRAIGRKGGHKTISRQQAVAFALHIYYRYTGKQLVEANVDDQFVLWQGKLNKEDR